MVRPPRRAQAQDISFLIGYAFRVTALYLAWEEPLAFEPTGVYKHADMADPQALNAVIWFACRGDGSREPPSAVLPAYEAIRLGILDTEEVPVDHRDKDDDD